MFRKVLVANRGEIAVRVIRALKELNIPSVAIYSEADKDSLHIKIADEAYCVGPVSTSQSYLNIPSIMSVAEVSGADAVHQAMVSWRKMLILQRFAKAVVSNLSALHQR